MVLSRMVLLENIGFKCKFEKYFFGQDEIKYLGYVITSGGIKPNPKKDRAILDIQRPTTTSEVRHSLLRCHNDY